MVLRRVIIPPHLTIRTHGLGANQNNKLCAKGVVLRSPLEVRGLSMPRQLCDIVSKKIKGGGSLE